MAGTAYAFFDAKDRVQLGRDLPLIRTATHTPDSVRVRLMPYTAALADPTLRRSAEGAEGYAVRYPSGADPEAISAAQRKTGFEYAAEVIGDDAPDEAAAILNNVHMKYQQGKIARMAIVHEEGGRRVFRD